MANTVCCSFVSPPCFCTGRRIVFQGMASHFYSKGEDSGKIRQRHARKIDHRRKRMCDAAGESKSQFTIASVFKKTATLLRGWRIFLSLSLSSRQIRSRAIITPPSLYPSSSHLQLYMIMALMAALLMRLRCFLLRRGEAGRNGTRRADAEVGATVERAGGNREKE